MQQNSLIQNEEQIVSTDPIAWLILLKAPGLGPVRIRNLIQIFNSPESVINASASALKQAKVPNAARRWLKQAKQHDVKLEAAWCKQPNNHIVSLLDSHYPQLLRNIHDAPPILFAKGQVEYLNLPQLAIVGSRKPTIDGQQAASQFSEYLAAGGLVITSGLAHGIDSLAHQGALKQGTTIAVCATGLDTVYPKANINLAKEIEQKGCLISEFLPGTQVRKEFFPRRNRLISGLSIGTLVVEAGIRSGSLITARMALEQGREVFAIPGSIHNPLAKGCHQLIKQGAKLVENADDIIEELQSQFQSLRDLLLTPNVSNTNTISNPLTDHSELDADYQNLIKHLDHNWHSIDELVESSAIRAEEISSMLLILELESRVQADGNGRYRKI